MFFSSSSSSVCPNSDDEDNEYLPLAILLDKDEGEEEQQMIGGDHSSRYELQRIQFQFNIKHGLWKINPVQTNGEEEKELEGVFDDIQFVAFNRQMQSIIQRDDQDLTG